MNRSAWHGTAIVAAVVAMTAVRPDQTRADDWDDIRNGNQWYAVMGCSLFPDGNISFNNRNAIYLNQFERAGANDAAIAANAAGVTANAQAIAANAQATAANTAALTANAQGDAAARAQSAANSKAIAKTQQAVAKNAAEIEEVADATEDNRVRIAAQSLTLADQDLAIAANSAAIDHLGRRVDELDQKFSRAIALFSALDFQRPLAGKRFRVGMGAGTYDDESAVGLTMTAVVGPVDLSVGAATCSGEHGAKANVGFSF